MIQSQLSFAEPVYNKLMSWYNYSMIKHTLKKLTAQQLADMLKNMSPDQIEAVWPILVAQGLV